MLKNNAAIKPAALHWPPIDAHMALRRLLQPHRNPKRSGLAAAAWPAKRNDLAVVHREVEISQDIDRFLTRPTERLSNVMK